MSDEQTVEETLPRLAYQAHAFSSVTHHTTASAGMTVADMVDGLDLPLVYAPYLRVLLADEVLPVQQWATTVPAAGTTVYVQIVPQGGSGGGKDLLRILSTIAIAIAAVYTGGVAAMAYTGAQTLGAAMLLPGGALIAGAVSAGVSILGNLALNALIPPPKPLLDGGDGLGSAKNQLTGSSNRFAPYAPIPRVFGKRRVYPMLAGRPYSETSGDDEYLRLALLVGWGPLKISDIRLGDTPITSFQDVELEVREGWSTDAPLTLYTSTVSETAYAILLAPPTGDPLVYAESIRRTETGVNEIVLDITAPAGLVRFNNEGGRESIDVDVIVAYRSVAGGAWIDAVWSSNSDPGLDVNGRIRLTGKETSTIRRSGRIKVPVGQYDVRVIRTTGEYDVAKHVQEVRWTSLRSIKPSYPVTQTNVSLIALRIKATDQLNGVPQTINCLAEAYLPIFNGSTWSYGLTRNPAWAFCDVLRRRGGAEYIPDSRIDLATIQAWAAACDVQAVNAVEPRWSFDGVIEGGSVFQVLRQIASTARANYTLRDGRHSVVRDIQQTVPIQHVTPRNSSSYSGGKVFLDYPHALRVVFSNAEKGYEEDERIVYDDGYDSTNASKFETLELFGCTSSAQAWREGRYHIASARLRPETHTVTMDVENVRCALGDLIQFQYDVVSIGIMSARVVAAGGGSITLDEELPIGAGNYALRVRLASGGSVVLPITGGSGRTVSVPSAAGVQAGDLALFGLSSTVSAPMVVRRIEPGPDLSATLTLVDAQDGVYTADSGPIPAFNSNLTIVRPPEERAPEQAVIASLRSDSTVAIVLSDGTVENRIAVSLAPPVSSLVRIDVVEVQFRPVGAANWQADRFLRASPIFLTPVLAGVAYEVRARYVTEYGVTGPWSFTLQHTVVGKNSPPADPTGLSWSIKPGQVVLQWAPCPDNDYFATEVRVGASWSAGAFVWRGAANAYNVARPPNGTYTYWIAHLDTTGNYSATPQLLTVTVDDTISAERLVVLSIYRRATSTPALPTADATYSFTTLTLTGLNNGWTSSVPAGSDPLYVATATAAGQVTDVIATNEWSTPQILSQGGLTTAAVSLYRRSTTGTAPTVTGSATATYTFSSAQIADGPLNWTPEVPASGGGYLWVIQASAASTGLTDTIPLTEWTTPRLVAQNGADGSPGLNNATVYLFQRTLTDIAPTLPGQAVTYTFATGAASGLTNGWTQTLPSSGGGYRWVTTATASSAGATDTIAVAEWTGPNLLAQDGSAGTNGANGINATLYGTAILYQWATAQPGDPSGSSTFTWATGSHAGYTGTNGWSVTIGANPGTPLARLWTATKTITAAAGSVTSTVSWTAGSFTVQAFSSNGANGANGLQSSEAIVYQWAATIPAAPSGSATFTWSSQTFGAAPAGWSLTPGTSPSAGFTLWAATVAVTDAATATTTAFSWTTASITARGYAGSNGSNGTRTAILDMYQWASAAPTTFPSGTSTYTWSTGQFTAPATTNGWTLTPGASSPGQTLYVARTIITNSETTATTGVTWNATSAFSTGAAGANGTRTAFLEMYRWSATTPTTFPSGTSTYTWATGAFTAPGTTNSWSLTPGTAVVGQTLWACSVRFSDTGTSATSSVTWNTSVAYAVGSAGSNGSQGASYRAAYARIANNPTPVSGTITVTGDNRPTQTQSNTTWGLNVAWSATDPLPSSTNTLYVTDGIYDPATGNTVWATPYISSLKVGTLSAVTVNTGNLTANGTITVNGGDIRSNDFVAGSTGWRIDSTTAEFPAASIRGQITASQINSNGLTIKDNAGNIILGSGTALSSNSVAAGTGTNLLADGSFRGGHLDAQVGFNDTGVAHVVGHNLAPEYTLTGEGTGYLYRPGTPLSGKVFDANFTKLGTIPCSPGERFEVSALLNPHRCSAYSGIAFLNSAGAYISEAGGNVVTNIGGTTTLISNFQVSRTIVTVPATATQCFLYVRGVSTGLFDPYVFFSRGYIGRATAAQTEYSPWSSGGGIKRITVGTASTYIADLAVNTLQIAGNAVTIPDARDGALPVDVPMTNLVAGQPVLLIGYVKRRAFGPAGSVPDLGEHYAEIQNLTTGSTMIASGHGSPFAYNTFAGWIYGTSAFTIVAKYDNPISGSVTFRLAGSTDGSGTLFAMQTKR